MMALSNKVKKERKKHYRTITAVAAVGLSAIGLTLSLAGGSQAAELPINMGDAHSFAVLAGAGVTNTDTSTVTGDIGSYPTATFVGLAKITEVGWFHGGDSKTRLAKTDMLSAYNAAAADPSTKTISTDLGGTTLAAGTYKSASSLGLNGTLTLDGRGSGYSVFIFQAGSTLSTAAASHIVLINGAQACNIFWQVGSSATLGANSTFSGTVLAKQDVTLATGVTVDGRVQTSAGAISLTRDTITKPNCDPATWPVITPTPTPTPTPTVTPTPTPTPQVPNVPQGGVKTGDGSTAKHK
jgi:hypothetical protein